MNTYYVQKHGYTVNTADQNPALEFTFCWQITLIWKVVNDTVKSKAC